MQREIDDLKKQLHRAQQGRSSSSSDVSSNDEETLFIDRGQELHKANPSPMTRSVITGENIEALLVKEWELTL